MELDKLVMWVDGFKTKKLEKYKNKKWAKGIAICPDCGGKLYWSLHPAGKNKKHMWGKCETDNCIQWTE